MNHFFLKIKNLFTNIDNNSDGYHTFQDLYDYREAYNAAFFNEIKKYKDFNVHKSMRNSDGKECFGGGWFVVMATLPTGQISNHYEMKFWDDFNVAVRECAETWDGHTPKEALERIRAWNNPKPKSF